MGVCVIDVEGVQIFTRVDSNPGWSLTCLMQVFLKNFEDDMKAELSCLKKRDLFFPNAVHVKITVL